MANNTAFAAQTTVAIPTLNPASGIVKDQQTPNPAIPNQLVCQIEEWNNIQTYCNNAINHFPNLDDFTTQFGTFDNTQWSSDNDTTAVEACVAVLKKIVGYATEYGNPQTLWNQINTLATSSTPPTEIYGNAVWLADQIRLQATSMVNTLEGVFNQTVTALTQAGAPSSAIVQVVIGAILGSEYATTIPTTADITSSLNAGNNCQAITDGFAANGVTLSSNIIVTSNLSAADRANGVGTDKWWLWDTTNNEWYFIANVNSTIQFFDGSGEITNAAQLVYHCRALNDLMSAWTTKMTAALTGPTESLQWYLSKEGNILDDAKAAETTISDSIAATIADLHSAQSDYTHDVIVAATSACYAWVFPIGTIAAAIVAGIYGAKATAAKKEIQMDCDSIASLNTDLQKKMNLVAALTTLNTNVQGVSDNGNAFVAAVETLEGGFVSVTGSLSAIADAIVSNVEHVSKYTDSAVVATAKAAWSNIAAAGQGFLTTGLITVPVSGNLATAAANPAIQAAAKAVAN
jgi:hypothetical protein